MLVSLGPSPSQNGMALGPYSTEGSVFNEQKDLYGAMAIDSSDRVDGGFRDGSGDSGAMRFN